MIYISNAFALSMLDRAQQAQGPKNHALGPIGRTPRPVDDPREWLHARETALGLRAESIIGHADVAALISAQLGRELPPNRVTVRLAPDDMLLVAQYVGPRLPEGTTELPAAARLEWWAA